MGRESAESLVGERCERRAVERRRRRGERDASSRATGWGIVSRTAWWGATNRGFVAERREKGQRSGTAPLLPVSLSPSGGVQSSRASRATRTRLFYVPGSVKDSLSQGLENGSRPSPSRVSFSPRAITADRRSIVADIGVRWKRTGVGTSAFFSSPPGRMPRDLGWPISPLPGGQLNAREPDRPLRGRKPRNTPTSWPT